MSDDLVYRLRNELGWGIGPAMLCQEAAARIDKLQMALRLIADHPVQESKQWEVGCKEMKKIARAALEGKKDD